jgi:hypothetical protein
VSQQLQTWKADIIFDSCNRDSICNLFTKLTVKIVRSERLEIFAGGYWDL